MNFSLKSSLSRLFNTTNIALEKKFICIVAIAKDEVRFLDEWIIYHKLIGVDHIYIYDDDEPKILSSRLAIHGDFVTVIPWYRSPDELVNVSNQIHAYIHSFENYITDYQWVTFIDIDEFLVFPGIDNIKTFVTTFNNTVSEISLNWHVFGHNGYYDDPSDFITSALFRRMSAPSENVKSIVRTKSIRSINQHTCKIKDGRHVDANGRDFTKKIYPNRTIKAHVNHYQCRSFITWMKRGQRGDVNFQAASSPTEQSWRFTEDSLLKQFVTTVALNKNETIDNYLIKFKDRLTTALQQLNHIQ